MLVWVEDETEAEKLATIESEPDTCTTTPHDGYPTVLVRFSGVDVEELTELLTESWRLRAPKRLVAVFESRS